MSFGPLLLLLTLCLTSTACYQSIEGCLDPNAINYGLDVDRECDDCCTYPQLYIRLVNRWTDADTTFLINYNSTAYEDGGGHAFTIDRITYYLRDFALIRSSGAAVYPTDTVLVQQRSSSGVVEETYVRDDYLLINPGVSPSLSVGTLRENGDFSQLRFQLGLVPATDEILPGSLPENHPLSLLDSSMYLLDEARYLSNRLDLERRQAGNTTPLLLSYGSERPSVSFVLDLPANFSLPAGFNVQITMEVNYAEWFRQVQSITTATEPEILSGIVAGLPNSFSVLEIRLSTQQF